MGAELEAGKRLALLEALAAGSTILGAAKAVGYSNGHVHRLLKDPAFVADLARRREARGSIPPSRDEVLALEALRKVIDSGDAEDKDVIAAAKVLLAHTKAKPNGAKIGPAPPPVLKVHPSTDGKQAADAWLKAHG